MPLLWRHITQSQAEAKEPLESLRVAPLVTGSLLPWQVPLHPIWQPHRTAVSGQCTLCSSAAAPVSGHDGPSPRRPSVGKKGQGAVGYGHLPRSADRDLGGIALGLPEPQRQSVWELWLRSIVFPCEWWWGRRSVLSGPDLGINRTYLLPLPHP